MEMKELIRQHALALGFDDCRFTTAAPTAGALYFQAWLQDNKNGEMAWMARNAEKRVNPDLVLNGAKTIIALAISYADENEVRSDSKDHSTAATSPAPTGSPHGVIARYARYTDYHDVLKDQLKALNEFVNAQGGPETRSLWYVDTGPILEREMAQRAGIGFIGKHNNVISRKLSNWIILAEIITTLELPPDEPEKNRCGTCTSCITACPTGAITAPFQLDARRCISYLTIELKGAIPVELRPLIGNRIFGCDDCLAACPWNKFAQSGKIMKAHAQPNLGTQDLIELLSLDNAGFKQRFAGTPLIRTKRRGVLRNVCVALGNVGDERALPALEKAAQDVEPLIVEHALWAIAAIKARCGEATKNPAPDATAQPAQGTFSNCSGVKLPG
ncbi:MAG: tRNA epoxyqueuosine(34) reductase QueG [Verrucomicrobiae bacterium]|nr:tRNA epoxyqueuosine(34) reductase QueG [Verrucomicrobiae bacterium]